MQNAGYSAMPLTKKLGIKDGFKIRLINQPDYYFNLFSDFPQKVQVLSDAGVKKDFIHYFTREAKQFEKDIAALKKEITPSGIIWISWPKKASKVATDITEDVIRNYAIASGLVDIKVCSVDEIWSGLKLVIPVKDRK